MKYFALVMSAVYFAAGAMIAFTNFMYAQITRFRLPLGIVLMAYGIVRWFIWRRKEAQSREE
jgi:hypothetical protein